MNKSSQVARFPKPLVGAAVAGVLVALGACASAPPAPVSALYAAKVAITNAVAANESSGGRQLNRRVEVIIENPRPAIASN